MMPVDFNDDFSPTHEAILDNCGTEFARCVARVSGDVSPASRNGIGLSLDRLYGGKPMLRPKGFVGHRLTPAKWYRLARRYSFRSAPNYPVPNISEWDYGAEALFGSFCKSGLSANFCSRSEEHTSELQSR